jgi:pimeloyl-ACP methyl ester carboxylesterase
VSPRCQPLTRAGESVAKTKFEGIARPFACESRFSSCSHEDLGTAGIPFRRILATVSGITKAGEAERLDGRAVALDGGRAEFGVGGQGLPVLFLPGWALGWRAYQRALKRLVSLGCRVYAPSLPGVGRSSALPSGRDTLAHLAAWADRFLGAVGIDEPVLCVGHSLGGAVATRLACDFPTRVGGLVLVNPLGGGVWKDGADGGRPIADRPLWDWAVSFPVDLITGGGALPTISSVLDDVVCNVVHHPRDIWRSAHMARRLDLTAEMAEIQRNGVPTSVLWGAGDRVVPMANFDAICAATGSAGELVPGSHAWLISDPASFARAMIDPVTAALQARRAAGTRPGTPHGVDGGRAAPTSGFGAEFLRAANQ